MSQTDNIRINVLKLTNGDIIMGNIVGSDDQNVIIEHPYSIYDIGDGPCVMPYEMPTLLAPMENITLRMFDVMWNKKLKEFSVVYDQYIAATTGIETKTENLILD